MTTSVCVNARFRHQRMTGVQRYAHAVLSRLPSSVQSLAPGSPSFGTGLRGHVWEQTRLPSQVLGRVLWSPCNTGPLGVRRHVLTVHDAAFLDCPDCFSLRFRKWYQWLIPRLIKSARHLLTVSRFSAERLIEHFNLSEDDVSVIPNGVDERFQPASTADQQRVKAQYQLPREFVLTLGSLDPRKNLRGICRAWQSRAALQGVPLVVVGGASNVFAPHIDTTVPTSTRFLDYLPDADLPALYSAATVFLYPSLYEGFGLPPLEAMACGTPTVVSATTALPEVVADAAVTVDPSCHESIAAGVCQALEDSKRRSLLSKAGIARARKFRWETTAHCVWNVLREID